MKGTRSGVGRIAFRLYTAAYLAVLTFGVLADLGRGAVDPAHMSSRATALAGLGVVAVIALVGLSGRSAVALRPTAADIPFRLLAPITRRRALRRHVVVGVCTGMGLGAALALVAVAAFPGQLGGLPRSAQLAYIALAAVVGASAFGAQLAVAARRSSPLVVAGAAAAATCAADAIQNTDRSPIVHLFRAVRTGDASGVPVAMAVGLAIVMLGWFVLEHIPLERIIRSGATSDEAALALSGNDVRSLLLAVRRLGNQRWRTTPLFRVPSVFVNRYPVTSRNLHGMARWKLSRWCAVVALAYVSGLLLAGPTNRLQATALASVVLWALGLTINEGLGQENDHSDRLALMPRAQRIETAHIAFGLVCSFGVLTVALIVTQRGHASVLTVIGLSISAAAGATASSVMSLRANWKLLMDPAMLGLQPEAIASKILFALTKPALLAFVCLSSWRLGATGLVVAGPGAIVLVTVFLIVGTNVVDRIRHTSWRLVP